jgi:hypothetical protein
LRPAPDPKEIARKHAEIARRYDADDRDRGRDRPRASIAALRVAELRRLFRSRHGDELPDTEQGRAAARLVAHHLAHRAEAGPRLVAWLGSACPWMDEDEREEIISTVFAKPIRWRADSLAAVVELKEVERTRLRITTIGAVDVTREERARLRAERKVAAERARRRARGAKPRPPSAARTKPWLSLGISRRTWYRRRAPATVGTSVDSIICL